MTSPTHHISIYIQTDATLPTGPIERTIECPAQFTLQNRETDYATVWAKLDAVERRKTPT